MTIQKRIIEMVVDGIKERNLHLYLISEFPKFTNNEINDEIEKVARNGEILELTYVLPTLEVKKFYLPRGSRINDS